MKFKFVYIVLFLIIFNQIFFSQSDNQNLPVSEQIKLILTTIKYDNHFMSNLDDELKIAVFSAENSASQKYKNQFLKIFKDDFKNKTFFERPFVITCISDTHTLAQTDVDIIIIAPGLKNKIKDILEITQKKKIISTTGISDYIDSGISIIVGLKEEKTFLAINLKNAKNENCDFSSRILKLAKIVE